MPPAPARNTLAAIMTRKNQILIIILIFQISSIAQLKTDTIDYSFDIKTAAYTLSKLDNTFGTNTIKYKTLPTVFYLGEGKENKSIFTEPGITCNDTDTIGMMSFYIPKGSSRPYRSKNFCIIHINKRTNILQITQCYTKKEDATAKFKIYKWTKNEIIIKEMTTNKWDRVYYLKQY